MAPLVPLLYLSQAEPVLEHNDRSRPAWFTIQRTSRYRCFGAPQIADELPGPVLEFARSVNPATISGLQWGAMAKLNDRIDDALNESRILILSAQVVIGFQFSAVFATGFSRLPRSAQQLNIVALGLMLIAMALTIAPTSYHQIAERGEDTERLHDFIIKVVAWALLPFALGLGINLHIATQKLAGGTAAALAGVVGTTLALFFWYGLGALGRRSRQAGTVERAGSQGTGPKEQDRMEDEQRQRGSERTALKDKIRNVLTEARMVLPGVQALLGFQFAIMFTDGFDALSTQSKYVHLASLTLTALSTILLITPAAYHRIVERGETTEHFHQLASRMVLASMVPVALSVCLDFYVIVLKVTTSQTTAYTSAALMLLFFYGLWFGFTLYVRGRRKQI